MPSARDVARGDAVVDHSVHGLVTIRLVNAPPDVHDGVVRELGEPQGSPTDEPDIVIRFTDELPRSPELRFLGLNQAAYDADSFYLLDDRGRRTRIDVDRLGEPCELVCERGVGAVPLLVPILALRLLRKGHVLLHASAFVYEDRGILVTGWQKGGKTEMLLPFMAAGARYVADEWTIVSGADGTLRGLTGVLRIWSWHFRHLPRFWARIRPMQRRRIQLVRLYQRLYRTLPEAARRQSRFLEQLSLEGGVAWLGQARSSPRSLFDDQVWRGPARLDRVFLPSVVRGETRVDPIDPTEVAERMVASLAYERRDLLVAYNQFRFAFPERTNELLETAREHELRLLRQSFADKPAYEVRHPYPVPLSDLYAAAVPFCR